MWQLLTSSLISLYVVTFQKPELWLVCKLWYLLRQAYLGIANLGRIFKVTTSIGFQTESHLSDSLPVYTLLKLRFRAVNQICIKCILFSKPLLFVCTVYLVHNRITFIHLFYFCIKFLLTLYCYVALFIYNSLTS